MTKFLIGATLASCVALSGLAQAGTITVTGTGTSASLTATNAVGASTSPFTLGAFGSSPTGLVSSSTLPLAGGGSIVFAPNASSPNAGVFSGSVPGVALSPFTTTSITPTNYLIAEPSDPVTINFGSSQSSFSLLWGSVDAYNSLTLSFLSSGTAVGSLTVTGSQVASAAGAGFLFNGTSPAFVTFSNYSGPSGSTFNQVILTSSTAAFEFDPSVQVPEPASLALLGAGLAGLGLLRRRSVGRNS